MALRMRWYVPQRQRFSFMASSMSASLGFLFFISRPAADMIWPAWQYPHCGTFSASHAFCSGCESDGESPSMVVIFLALTSASAVLHERIGSPSASTVHDPHNP